MSLPLGRMKAAFGSDRAGRWLEVVALVAVLVVAVLSWQMVHSVATAMYRQFEVLGDPPLMPIPVAGPELGATGPPVRPPSQLGHVGYFWSERAFHYRTTLMFAVEGFQDPAVLAHDTFQQHPDGVDSWREYALLMEPVYGFLYRLAGDQARPLVEFLLGLVPLIHVLMFFPLFAMARALGCGRVLAVVGVVFYATCTLGFLRMTGSLLLKEDFSLLLLTLFLAVHLHAWRVRSFRWTILAAILLIPLLASWHLSQFLVLVVLLGAAVAWMVGGPGEESRDQKIPLGVFMPLAYTAGGLTAGLTPSLWARGFWISLPMAVMFAWCLTAWLTGRKPAPGHSARARMAVLLGAIVVLGALVVFNRSYTGDYNHVFSLLVQKLVHGFHRPDNPLLLPFDIRVFWAPPFNTPTPVEVWSKLGWHAVVLVPVLVWCFWAIFRRGTDAVQRSFLLTVPAFLAAYGLVERLGVVFLVFAAPAVALGGQWLVRRLERSLGPRALIVGAGLLLVSPVLNLNGNLGDMIRITRSTRAGRDVRLGASDQATWQSWSGLFSWATTHTPGPGSRLAGEPAVFLGGIAVSPQMLLYAGRPIVLNSQFENAAIRRRYRRYLEALFATEEAELWEFARRYEADYIFINRDFATVTGPGSASWLAGVSGPLYRDMNVVRMHFQPEGLDGFAPVYDNEHYRVLQVLRSPGERPHADWQSDHNSWWRPGNFRFAEDGRLVDPLTDRARLAEFEKALSDLQDKQRDILAAVEKRWRGAGRPDRPDLMWLHRRFVQSRLEELTTGGGAGETGRLENTIRSRLSEIDPLSGKPLGTALARLAKDWLELLATHAGEPLHHAACGQLLASAGRYDAAVEQFAAAAALVPSSVAAVPGWKPTELQGRLWLEEVWWSLAAGRDLRARDLARAHAADFPRGSREAEFFLRVGAIPGDFE